MKKRYIFPVVIVLLGLMACLLRINQGSIGAVKGVKIGDVKSESSTGIGEKNPAEGLKMEFEGKDVYGNKVDSSIFKDKKITFVNIWGTFCTPCIEEIPEIQKFAEEYKEKVNVIGIITDPEEAATAKELLDSKEIKYTNVLMNEELGKIVNKFDYVPATLIVDESGTVLGKFVPGSTSYEDLKEIADGLLK